MVQWHGDLGKRRPTGGKARPYRGKRAFEMGSPPAETMLDSLEVKITRVRGGGKKIRLQSCDYANVTDPETKKTSKVEITRVVKNPANIDYDRRGVITKGTIIETPLGQAKITSKPGQTGVINALLMRKPGAE